MYEDVDYERSVKVTEETRLERKRVMLAERVIKKAAAVKQKKEPKAKQERVPKETRITAPQVLKLQKENEKIQALATELQKAIAASSVPELSDMIPGYCKNAASTALAKTSDCLAFIELLAETCLGSFQTAMENVKETKLMATAAKDNLSSMVSHAKDHLAAAQAAGA